MKLPDKIIKGVLRIRHLRRRYKQYDLISKTKADMIIEPAICFLLAAGISFIGSVQFGPVNLKVIQTTYNNGFNPAMMVAFGGIVPEIIYSAIAIWCSWFLLSNPFLFNALQLIAIPFFLISGIVMMMKKTTTVTVQAVKGHALFINGFIAGALNPMLFTFWFMVANFLVTGAIITLDTWPNRIAFVAGTASGAFLLLVFFAWLTQRNKQLLERVLTGKMNKLVGMMFIVLAAVQFIKWLK